MVNEGNSVSLLEYGPQVLTVGGGCWPGSRQPGDEQHAEEGHSMYKRLAEASIQAIQTHHAPGCPALLPLAAGFPVTIDMPSIPGYTSLPGQVAPGGQQRAAPFWATRHEHLVHLLAHVCPCLPHQPPQPTPHPLPPHTHTTAVSPRKQVLLTQYRLLCPDKPTLRNDSCRLLGTAQVRPLSLALAAFFFHSLPRAQLAALALAC